jgi:hypothetical protein
MFGSVDKLCNRCLPSFGLERLFLGIHRVHDDVDGESKRHSSDVRNLLLPTANPSSIYPANYRAPSNRPCNSSMLC